MKPLWRLERGRFLISGTAIAIVSAVSLASNTDLAEPPRFDGAGYAVLGEALRTARGYREIALPEPAWHAHFPPGYPTVLALLWSITGRSEIAAHLFSIVCTVAATLLTWVWFRRLFSSNVALVLGLALALNWSWARTGGAIQSEPLYFLLSQAALLSVSLAGRRKANSSAIGSGFLLGVTVLTRHVGACLAFASVLDLMVRRRWKAALTVSLVASLIVVPWVVWLIVVRRGTQVELLAQEGLIDRIGRQAVFYIQRIPDLVTGPIVEVGTVYRASRSFTALVNTWAALATGLVVFGWVRAIRSPRRRLAGLYPSLTLGLLLVWPFTEAGRFLIPLLPCLLVGAIEGIAPLALLASLRRPRLWAAGAVLAASLPYAAYSLATDRAGAQRRGYRDFDAACAWIVRAGNQPGPILARHPGEVFWLTHRQALSAPSDDPAVIDHLIAQYHVSYFIIDKERYSKAPIGPLSLYVSRFPGRIREVWSSAPRGGASVVVYEIVRSRPGQHRP